jgi:hypothetical protein
MWSRVVGGGMVAPATWQHFPILSRLFQSLFRWNKKPCYTQHANTEQITNEELFSCFGPTEAKGGGTKY